MTQTQSKKTKNFEDLDPDFLKSYMPQNKLRFVSATALFDGHDASINIMRRMLQLRGCEVIHLGHNRSAADVARAALQEDVQGVAISSYQGGHVEYFKYVRELLDLEGGQDVRIFGGGGGVISPKEIIDLENAGISKIFSPEDGQRAGLEGIIGFMLLTADFKYQELRSGGPTNVRLARAITVLEQGEVPISELLKTMSPEKKPKPIPVLGVTGTGGAGKSSLTDELVHRFLWDFPEINIALLCIDPSKKKTGGALLGDRIRFNSGSNDRVFLRSMATRGSKGELSGQTESALELLKTQNFDFIIVESSGIGQGDSGILSVTDVSLYVMTSEFGAQSQLEKIDMLDFADLVAINKFERQGAPDALRDVRAQLRRSRFQGQHREDSEYPVFGTIASRYNDDGVNGLYKALAERLSAKLKESRSSRRFLPQPVRQYSHISSRRESLIPANRVNYLAEIANCVRQYHSVVGEQVDQVAAWDSLNIASKLLADSQGEGGESALKVIKAKAAEVLKKIDPILEDSLRQWTKTKEKYLADEYQFPVRDRTVAVEATFTTLAGQRLPKVALPQFTNKGEIARFLLKENLPGQFPYTGGVFPFRREGEEPLRQFAGEGGPERTNKRFHYLSSGDSAKRLSTAFDSVTLYGSDPDKRPDIFGKVGESGVSIATLDDLKLLYKGFDLCGKNVSVSMTINGPAPIILAMFLNAAIDQQIDIFNKENGKPPDSKERERIYGHTLQTVRGTVQADILKEDQAQNTCIFSTEIALKMMADIQEYFIEKSVRNYYSVSISGYHIAEAGANPITQLALTLANGFTYVEYYLARGMKIDDFAPNLSFFFSNGIDCEYAVLGRVARRIWALAMKTIYKADERSQKLKYHIQTSGRSLHAQEIDFNDIRTTLQALLALYDNCNSLHTNAYDEAVTTPTEDSVRRAMAIQMIISREFGPNKCQNINQGSYFLEQLTDQVEEAVLQEFERISIRGGVLGAMETQYQRSKIQEESLHYERLKHSGEIPIIGVNVYQNPKVISGDYERPEIELIRSSYDEKHDQLHRLKEFRNAHGSERDRALEKLSEVVFKGENIFAELMHTVRHASLGEISETLYRVGGRYRRSM